jgi:hypothetical protein
MLKHLGPGMASVLLAMSAASAQPPVEKDVVFGMYSGAPLLMEVSSRAMESCVARVNAAVRRS